MPRKKKTKRPHKKLHIVQVPYIHRAGFSNAQDATRFMNLVAKIIPVDSHYISGDPSFQDSESEGRYYHIDDEKEELETSMKMNVIVELERREPKLKGLPAPLKGLPAPK